MKNKYCIYIILVVVLGGCATGASDVIPTLAVLPTTEPTKVVIFPSATATVTFTLVPPTSTATATEAPSSTPIPSPTITDTPSPTPTATVTNTLTPTLTITAPPKPPKSEEEILKTYISGFAEGEVYSVKIADGRGNNGERVAIIAYVTSGKTIREIAIEIGTIFGSIASAMKNEPLDIDSYVIIYGLSPTSTLGTAALNASDLVAYINGAIDETQLWAKIVFVDL